MINNIDSHFTLQNQVNIHDLDAMQVFASEFADACQPAWRVGLVGALGVGKTAWVRFFLTALGHKGLVRSPTYALVESYELPHVSVHHFDWYRLTSMSDLVDIDFDSYCQDNAIILVEWPDQIEGCLHYFDTMLNIRMLGEGGRVIEVMTKKDQ